MCLLKIKWGSLRGYIRVMDRRMRMSQLFEEYSRQREKHKILRREISVLEEQKEG